MLKKIILATLISASTLIAYAEKETVSLGKLLQQMSKDREIPTDCLRKTKNAGDLISVEPIKLRKMG